MNESLHRILDWRSATIGERSDTAIDVGAHHGIFAAELIESGRFAEVVAYEANPATCAILRERLATFGAKARVVNKAVGNATLSMDLIFDDDSATASLLPFGRAYGAQGEVKRITVPVVTLDEEFDRELIVSLLKIDTQGNDLSVVVGARGLISRSRPIIQTEINLVPFYEGQNTPEDMNAELRHLGYSFLSIGDIHIDEHGRLAFCDAVFVPSEWDIPYSSAFTQLDNRASLEKQIAILEATCAERLRLIEKLHNLLNA